MRIRRYEDILKEHQAKEKNQKKENLVKIPQNIQSILNEKGFYLYNWISPKDVKNSIERDFLQVINRIWLPLAIISIFAAGIFYQNIVMMLFVFFWIIFVSMILILLYLFFLWIKRSFLLVKNAYVIVTNDYFSINGKIVNKSDLEYIQYDIHDVSYVFDEELFWESQLEINKWWLLQSIKNKFFSGYSWIIQTVGRTRSKNGIVVLIVVLFLYTIYSFVMSIFYLLWALIVGIFANILSSINRFVLVYTGNEVLTINSLFEKIDHDSKSIEDEKNNLLVNLKDAKNNEWVDNLLTKINEGIVKINTFTNNAIETNLKLKTKLKKSKYAEMFNFQIYNSWVRKQILDPLTEIYEILDDNYKLLFTTIENIDKQISDTSEVSLQAPLVAQKKRLEMRKEEIERHINMIAKYLYKLKDEK